MNEKTINIKEVLSKQKTICVGRFLVDVPDTAEIIYGHAEVPSSIIRFPNAAEQIDALISDRLTEIADEIKFAEEELRGSDSMLGKVVPGQLPDQKIVFGVSEASGAFYRIHSYSKVKGDLFVQETESFSSKVKYEKEIRDLNIVASRLRARAEREIPTGPGVCIDGGFIMDPTNFEQEALGIGIRLAEFRDVHLSISVTKKSMLVPSDALEPRVRQAEQIARRAGQGDWYDKIRVLRRGARSIGNWKGYEILARKPAQSVEGESHEFAFVSQGAAKDPYLPVLSIELYTGVRGNQMGGTKPSISDDEALAIWDKVTTSIRVRSVEAQPAVPAAALGVLIRAGQCCPRSGWWICSDGSDEVRILGGDRQHFREGTVMPHATLVRQASFWHREIAFRTENPTIWTLVEADLATKPGETG